MAGFEIRGFRGRRPLLDPSLLENGDAQIAQNIRIQGGKFGALKNHSVVAATTTTGAAKTIYKYVTGDWFEWNTDVDVTTANIGEDAFDRCIFTGVGVPQVTYNAIAIGVGQPYPTVSRDLGVPAPGYNVNNKTGQAPAAAVVGAATDPTSDPETRFYVVTSIDEFGAEGAPTPVSPKVTWRVGQTTDVTIPTIPAGNRVITGWRLYRTNTGTSGTDFQLVTTGTSGWNAVYNDAIANEDLGEVLSTEDFNLPHEDMVGITELPNGYLAGFYDKTLFFSEPGFPHAFPIKYQLNTKVPIVGIKLVSDNALLVATEGKPYLAVGSDPASTTLQELDILQACVSKRSIVDVGDGVVYASPDGLVHVASSGANALTASVFSREQWQNLIPTTVEAYYWEGLYMAFYNDGTGKGFAISPGSPEGGIVDVTEYATAGYNDLTEDKLYLVVGSNIVEWEGANTYMTHLWASRELEPDRPSALPVIRIRADANAYPITVGYYDPSGNAIHTISVTDNRPTRFPGGRLDPEFELRVTNISNGGTLHRIELGETMTDMKAR